MGRYTTYREKPETGLESSLKVMLGQQLQEQKRKQDLQDAIALATAKTKIENEYDPKKKLLLEALGSTDNSLTENSISTKPILGDQSSNSVTPKNSIDSTVLGNGINLDRNKVIRGAISKEFGVPYEQMLSPEETQQKKSNDLEKEIAKKELTSMATMLPKLDQAFQATSQLEDLYYKGATPDKNPIMARLTGIPDAMVAKSGFNPDLNTYFNNLKAFSGLISKGGFGEAGMLTNQDIQRVINAFPTSSSTLEEARKGFSEVKKILGAARDRFEKTKRSYIGGNAFSGQVMNQSSQYKIGQSIQKGGKVYQVTGFDADGEPLVDLAR